MANGNPQFGTLDIGQPGGTRQLAGHALFTGHVFIGQDEVSQVIHGLAQQNYIFRDVLGYRGSVVRWSGVIRADSGSRMTTIMNDVNQYIHGARRSDTTAALGPPNPQLLEPRILKDAVGELLTNNAVLESFRQTARRQRGNEWAAIVPVELVFRRMD